MVAFLAGRAALVTGGSRGIGKAVCRALLKKKVKVCIADMDAKGGNKTQKELAYLYGKDNVIFQEVDVTNALQFEEGVVAAKKRFGHLDILVNNAGIMNELEWKKMMDINLKSVIQGTLLGFKHLTSINGKKGGNVVNVASILAFQIAPFLPAYCASKAAVGAWTRCWGNAENFKKTNVRVAGVCPDAVETQLIRKMTDKSADKTQAKEAFTVIEPDLLTYGLVLDSGSIDAAFSLITAVSEYMGISQGDQWVQVQKAAVSWLTSETARAFIKVLEDNVTGLLCLVTHDKGAYYVLDNASEEVTLGTEGNRESVGPRLLDHVMFWKRIKFPGSS